MEITSITGEEHMGKGWKDVYKYPWNYDVGKRNQNPQWLTDVSTRFNAALRHSVGCVQDKEGFPGFPCDEAGWVGVEALLDS